DSKIATLITSSILLVGMIGFVAVSKYPFTNFTNYSWDKYCLSSYNKCSPKSAEFLIKNHLTKNLFTPYAWGGWLIWNYPEIKPVIDGRMHIWVDETGYSGFAQYYEFVQNHKEIDYSVYDVVYMTRDKPLY